MSVLRLQLCVTAFGLALAACASPVVPTAVPTAGFGPISGVVVAVRPLRSGESARVLAVLAPGSATVSDTLNEIIVRDGAGRVLSVVQPASVIRPGTRVVVEPGDPSRVAAVPT